MQDSKRDTDIKNRLLDSVGECWGPALAGSRGYPQDEWCRREKEKTREASLEASLKAKSARERERERDQTGGAESGRVWQSFIFYHSFYTLS